MHSFSPHRSAAEPSCFSPVVVNHTALRSPACCGADRRGLPSSSKRVSRPRRLGRLTRSEERFYAISATRGAAFLAGARAPIRPLDHFLPLIARPRAIQNRHNFSNAQAGIVRNRFRGTSGIVIKISLGILREGADLTCSPDLDPVTMRVGPRFRSSTGVFPGALRLGIEAGGSGAEPPRMGVGQVA